MIPGGGLLDPSVGQPDLRSGVRRDAHGAVIGVGPGAGTTPSAWFDWRFPVIGLHPGGGNRRMLQELVAASVRAGRQFASVR